MPFEAHGADPGPDADELVRRARVAAAVRDRHRHHAMAAHRLERLGVVDALLGAVGHAVLVHTTAGDEPLSGTVSWVGSDVVELLAATRRWWVRLDQVVAVQGAALGPGDRADRMADDLLDVLTDLVDSGRTLIVLTTSGASWRGVVDAVGAALVLRRPGPDTDLVISLEHVAAAGVAHHGTPTG